MYNFYIAAPKKLNKFDVKNGEMGVGDFFKSPRPIFIEKQGV